MHDSTIRIPRKWPEKGKFARFSVLAPREEELPDRVNHLVALLLLISAASRFISEWLAERSQQLSSNFYSLRFPERFPLG